LGGLSRIRGKNNRENLLGGAPGKQKRKNGHVKEGGGEGKGNRSPFGTGRLEEGTGEKKEKKQRKDQTASKWTGSSITGSGKESTVGKRDDGGGKFGRKKKKKKR